jgi:hypothetical protein
VLRKIQLNVKFSDEKKRNEEYIKIKNQKYSKKLKPKNLKPNKLKKT